MDDQLWYDFYDLGVQYARDAGGDAHRLHPDTVRDAVCEHIAHHELVEDSFDPQSLHYAFALGVKDTLTSQLLF